MERFSRTNHSFFINETVGYIKSDDTEIQVVTIKRLPPFIDELFLKNYLMFQIQDVVFILKIQYQLKNWLED